jgi:hypothetical protein
MKLRKTIIGYMFLMLVQNIALSTNSEVSAVEKQEYQQELTKIKEKQKSLSPELDKKIYRKDPNGFTKQFMAFRDNNDLNAYEIFADDILNKWAPKNPEYYGRLVLELCDPLGSGNFSDIRAYDLSRKYALSALEKSKDIPVELELELTNRVVVMTIGRGAHNGQELEQIRRKIVEVRLNAWNRLLNSIDSAWDPNEQLSVYPDFPRGVQRWDSGMDPKGIEDPVIRAEYEAALAENQRKIEKHVEQNRLRDWLKQYPKSMEIYFIYLYSTAPYNNDELVRYLKDSKLDEQTKARIINTVNENIKQSKKAAPAGK